MLTILFSIVCVSAALVSGQNWLGDSHVEDYQKFFSNVIQETVYDLERREWCNLKTDNIYQTINDSLYNFIVNGTVKYHNGFLISIQKMDITNMESLIASNIEEIDNENVTVGYATVRGNLNLHDVVIGFDVEVNLVSDGLETIQKYTGTYNYAAVKFQLWIQKNLNTGEITSGSSLLGLENRPGVRMIYMPANNVTEALSRRWRPNNIFDGIKRWGPDHMAPIMAQIVTSRMPFPEICIGCYA